MDWLYTASGFTVGIIVGLTGVGGGSLMTPLLVLFFGISPATAVGTDLLYAAITKAGGTVVHGRQGHVEWRLTGLLAAGSLPAAAITIIGMSFLPKRSDELTQLISVILGIALLLTSLALFFGRRVQQYAAHHDNTNWRKKHLDKITVLVGVLLGVLVSISSVGAGALGVAALFFLYPKLSSVKIVGSDVAHAVPLTLVAGLGHWWLGSVNWTLLGALLLGSLPGIYIGSRLSAKIPEHILRRALAVMLVLIGSKLLLT